MRFNSVKRGNFSGLAGSVNRSMDQVFNAARSTAVDHTMLAKESIKGRSKERRAAMKAEGEVSRAGLKAVAQTKGYKEKADVIKDIGEKRGKKARMAGALGALGSLAGGFVIKKGREDDKKAWDEREAQFDQRMEQTKQVYDAAIEALNNDKPEYPTAPTYKPPKLETYPDGSGGDSSGGSQSSTPTTYQSQPLATAVDVSKLNDDDFKHLAYAISSEAGPGKDRYGVAASILNRVSSDKWPGSVKDVIFQDGQYEGVYKGLSKWDSGIAADLSSDTGRAEIVKALKVLDGRTDFKGQTMLKYRSGKGNKGGMLDPMFDPKGNFFHYSHQT